MKKVVIFSVLALALSGAMSMNATASDSTYIDALHTISDAEAAIKKAKKVDGEWRDSSGKYLKQAKAAMKAGDHAKALKLAKQAKFEGEMGYQQAMSQKNAGPWAF